MTEPREATETDRFVTDILNQVAEVTNINVLSISRVELRPGELDVTRYVSVGQNEDGEDQLVRVVDTVPWVFIPSEVEADGE